eukprot:CAMPEP_0170093502 /NCGR_PEP_ID=MMETSP0019_2-20121128/26561_1 /TAXON_ID=98059 /ORGANISM="Dinobryon sp., Strain UTEXLB2267" /LENGTH=77 /DNA_ID=CAMNT_0010314379 /DNA_START=8 /DNA_END=238 /DNA_ORIENTATION=+
MTSTNSNSNSLSEKPGSSDAVRPVRAKKVKVDQKDHDNNQWTKKKKKNGVNVTDNSSSSSATTTAVPIAPLCASPPQ